jgi:hypothetical protein
MKRIFLTGYCKNDRIESIYEIERIILRYGHITDFQKSSDMSINFRIELEEEQLEQLFESLNGCISMNDYDPSGTHPGKECVVFLNVTFKSGTGDLSIEAPSVPG